MPKILSRLLRRADTDYPIDTFPDAGSTAAVATIDRRWFIWSARLVLTATAVCILVLLHTKLNTPEVREALVMSTLAGVVLVTWFLLWAHEVKTKIGHIPRTRFVRRLVTFGASIAAVGLFLMGAQADPEKARTKIASDPKHLWPLLDGLDKPAIHRRHLDLLPRFSAKLDGVTTAPISLVFLGTGDDLLDTFAAAGWHAAERVTPETALRAFGRGVLNKPYPTAPVFPSFLDGKLHDVAFQKHDEGDSSRRRHHVRWWHTEFVCEGRPVWVATASYDAGVGISRFVPLPIHHIDPDIDKERDYIVASLTATGRVELTQKYRVTDPMTGRNAAGDAFFTSGVACVLA